MIIIISDPKKWNREWGVHACVNTAAQGSLEPVLIICDVNQPNVVLGKERES